MVGGEALSYYNEVLEFDKATLTMFYSIVQYPRLVIELNDSKPDYFN